MDSPMTRSLALMRELGYFCWRTEHWDGFAKKRKDLWGFCDIICVMGKDIVAVQTTSYNNISARVKKITEHENVAVVRKAGIRIFVHGWHKVGSHWKCRTVDLS